MRPRAPRLACLIARPVLAMAIATGGGAAAQQATSAAGSAASGAYLVRAAGCIACHTAKGGATFAGGREMKTPFGTFYTPNITPDKKTGIGAWSDADFDRALRHGTAPDGGKYYPVFPYASYALMTAQDASAIKTYLFTLKPVERANRAHELRFPFSMRILMRGWRMLFFADTPLKPAGKSPEYDRGEYLVRALTHCGECHTPRNQFGAMRESLFLAGNAEGPDNELVPNITPDKKTGIGDWAPDEIAELLKSGESPLGTDVGGAMREAIRDGLKFLTEADRKAIATFLLAQKPIANKVSKTKS